MQTVLTTPFDDALAALDRARGWGGYFEALPEVPDEPGWIPSEVFPAPHSAFLDDELGKIASETASSDGRVLSAFLIHRYTWRLSAPAAAVYLCAGVFPTIAREVWLKLDGDPMGVAFRIRSSGAPAHVEEAAFKNGLTTHLAPLIAELRSRLPLGERAMWAIAADACASAILSAGEQLGSIESAVAAIQSLLLRDEPHSRLRARTGFFTVDVDGQQRIVLRRGSCCQSFRVDGFFCSTCPRVSEHEQRTRAAADLRATAEQ